ncbi:hypothetical protein THMA_1047 [Thermotoga maritima MSB8]|uniref:hypothetical protein n=1 Tax=Thermotoga TaxID=2335 RepID=UPI00022D8B2C|nr:MULTISPECIES: hypothetical protein [Thermotoga]AGL49952.1 hypothetical protein Tmari_1028 [Thermotoga maritima MSB8]AHD19067.1 hypothetical protein THEMA_09235 [Thermotoga maritima MSB8]AIY87304.1 hypothetical protein T2812B_08915 [Thermotoga sp. 2812B]AKE26936.1 hypothetical protein THMC_1047 [Thermotoga maritima]AKE28801.1 hypothetical protein THMA_1047 [Thermotoga maritima MSB8]
MKKFVVLLVVLVLVSCFAQVPDFLFSSKYPVSEWIRPGLVVVYQHEGGTQSGESALYATGYRILIVTDVQNSVPCGIGITLFIHLTDSCLLQG